MTFQATGPGKTPDISGKIYGKEFTLEVTSLGLPAGQVSEGNRLKHAFQGWKKGKPVPKDLHGHARDHGHVRMLEMGVSLLGDGNLDGRIQTLAGKKSSAQLKGRPNPILVISGRHQWGISSQDCLPRRQFNGGFSVRENILRTCLLDELRRRLCSEDGIAHARKRLAERLGELTRENGDKVRERRARLDKVEREIGNLIDFVAAGRGTQAVSTRLKALELEAAAETKALAGLERALSGPIKLPDPKKLVELAFDLERRLNADVQRGREELRRLFRDGRIDLLPQPGRFYVARSELLPLVLLSQNPPEVHSGGQDQIPRYSAVSCAGRI